MTGRRNGRGIRGPQSALTDFLAANNISAAQIRTDYERRRRETDENGEGPSNEAGVLDADADELSAEQPPPETEANKKKRKRKRRMR